MKKKKTLLLATLSIFSAVTCACAVGCNPATTNPDDELLKGNYEGVEDVVENPADALILQSISLDLTGVTQEYNYGDEFDATNKPVVKATFVTVDSAVKHEETSSFQLVTEEKTIPAADVKIDYGQYDKNSVGTYNIYVSYTHAGVTRSASYTVTVKSTTPEIGGITAQTSDPFKTVIPLTAETGETGVTISLEGLQILKVDENQEIDEENPIPMATEENPDGYTLTYYCEGTVIESLEGLGKGEYTIMASYNGAKTFVVVSVVDSLASIEVKPEVEGAKFTQVQSVTDELTSTWVFTVTYASGLTLDLKKGDAGLLIGGVNTITAGERTVKATYYEGTDKVEVTVSYEITAAEGLTEETHALTGISALPVREPTADPSTPFTAADLTGDNAFITPLERLRHRGGSNASYVDFNGEALSVTTNGFGMLQIAVRTTGAAHTSGLYLADKDGKYIAGIFDSGVGISEVETTNGKAYTVSDAISTSFRTITFILPEAGTYKLGSLATGSLGVTQAYTRMNSLVLTDVYDNANIDVVSYELTLNTANVTKDYISTGTAPAAVDIANLTATYKETHTLQDNVEEQLTAEQLTAAFTGCNWSNLGSKGSVTVTYTKDGKDHTAIYEINILSPIEIGEEGAKTDVNSIVAVMDQKEFYLEENATTLTIPTTGITLTANSADGEEITPANVAYELYVEDAKQESLTVGVGTYSLKVIATLNNTKVEGTTAFTAVITGIVVKEYVSEEARTTTVTFTGAQDGSAVVLTPDKTDRVVKISTTGVYASNTRFPGTNNEYAHAVNVQSTATNTRTITIDIEGSVDETVNITVYFYHTTGSGTERSLGIFEGEFVYGATPLVQKATTNQQLETLTLTGKSDGKYSITCTDGTTLYVAAVAVEYLADPAFANQDFVDYDITLDTENVKTVYYVGEDTQLDTAGLGITFSETHSKNTDQDKEIPIELTDAKLNIGLTGDLNKRGTTGTVTVTYTVSEDIVLKKTYSVEIVSTVTGVNSVELTKETVSYTLASAEAETVEISNTDLVLHKNTAKGDEITLGESESVEYKLYKGEEELDTWEVGEGTYTIKATIVLNNTEAAVAGTTTFTAEITVKVNAYVVPGSTQTITANLVLNAEAVGNITTAWTWYEDTDGNKLSILPAASGTAVSIDASGKKIDSSSNNLTHRIKLGGEATTEARSLKIEVKSKATITLYLLSSNGTDARTLKFLDSTGTAISLVTCATLNGEAYTAESTIAGTYDLTNQTVAKLEITVETGTYYFGSASGGLNIHGGKIAYEKATSGDPATPAAPTTLNADDLAAASLSSGQTLDWGDCAVIMGYGTDKVVVDTSSGKTLVGDAASVTTTSRIKIGGGIQSNGEQSVKLTLSAPCTIKAYVANSGDEERSLNLYDASKTGLATAANMGAKNTVVEITLTVTQEMITAQNGVFYLGGSGGFYLYYLTITYGA